MNKAFLILFSLVSVFSFSQENCGTYVSDAAMQTYYQRDRSHLNNNLKVGNVVDIPIVYHVTREDNGVGAFSLENTLRLHCELNDNFFDAEIKFYIVDIIFHDNSNMYHMTGSQGSGSNMMGTYNNLNACNIYIVQDAKSGSNSVCGYSYVPMFYPGPNRGGIVLDIGCSGVGSTTLSHEMGHYLNLPHTFYRWEGEDYTLSPIPTYLWERADGSNCATTGDGFCDTPADYISSRWQCTLPKIFADAVGTTFTVDEKNYMSYSMDGCQQYFKNDQMAEMKNTPATYRSYLSNLTVPNTSPLSQTNLLFPPVGNQGVSGDTINFLWNEVADADYYLFQLTYANSNSILVEKVLTTNSYEMYNLNINTDYKWKVKGFNYGYVCSDYVEGTFKTSEFYSTISIDNVFCKDAADGNAYASVTGETVSHYNWFEYDSSSFAFVMFNTTTSQNVVHGLASNSYYVEIVLNSGGIVTSFFNVTEPTALSEILTLYGTSIVANVTGGTPPYTYIWSNGENTSINSNPVVGVNTLYLSDANSCYKSSLFTYNGTTSSVNDVFEYVSNISLFPNPVIGDHLFVNLNSKKVSTLSLSLYAVDGKHIKTTDTMLSIGENQMSFKVEELNKGIYFLKMTIDNQTLTRRILL